jgi:hypothetical protein
VREGEAEVSNQAATALLPEGRAPKRSCARIRTGAALAGGGALADARGARAGQKGRQRRLRMPEGLARAAREEHSSCWCAGSCGADSEAVHGT